MQLVHFTDDFYDSGAVKYAADTYHPLNSETQSLVTTGYASLVNADDANVAVDVLQAIADIADERATAAEAQAAELRKEADAAALAVKAASAPKADQSTQ